MRGVLHAEVFGFNFSADINPYQRSDYVKGKIVVKLTSLPRLIGIPMVCVCDAALLMMRFPSGGGGLMV